MRNTRHDLVCNGYIASYMDLKHCDFEIIIDKFTNNANSTLIGLSYNMYVEDGQVRSYPI